MISLCIYLLLTTATNIVYWVRTEIRHSLCETCRSLGRSSEFFAISVISILKPPQAYHVLQMIKVELALTSALGQQLYVTESDKTLLTLLEH